jgi:hypothetical protein
MNSNIWQHCDKSGAVKLDKKMLTDNLPKRQKAGKVKIWLCY